MKTTYALVFVAQPSQNLAMDRKKRNIGENWNRIDRRAWIYFYMEKRWSEELDFHAPELNTKCKSGI